jgi:hypothetical protein
VDLTDPYAPPRAALDGGTDAPTTSQHRPWRIEGRILIVRKNETLPPICLYSGQAVQHGEERGQLSWTPIWFRLMWGFATLIALLAHSFVRRTATIHLTLGPAARQRRKRGNWVGVLGVVLAALTLALGVAEDLPALTLLAFPILIAALVFAAVSQPFGVVKIDRSEVRLKLTQPAAEAFARVQL